MEYEIKTLSPLSAQAEKKTVLFTCCCDVLFAVILTLHSTRMIPKFYNLRSKEKWFLVRPPLFFLFLPTCYCMSKLVMQSRNEVKRLTRGSCSERKNCLSESQSGINSSVKMTKHWTLDAASDSETFVVFILLSWSSSGWLGGKEP